LVLSLIGLLLCIFAYAYTLSVKKVYSASSDEIMLGTVREGVFEDIVLLNTTVVPLTSVIVSSPEGGTVAEIITENGAYVTKGTPLVRISNPNALSGYTGSETSIIEQINQLRKLRLDLQQNQRVMKQDMMSVENSLRTASRKYRTDSVLLSKQVITLEEFRASKQDFEYLTGRRAILKQALDEGNRSKDMQLRQIDFSIGRMNENLETIRLNIENMTIKAPVSGRLSSYDPVIGKPYTSNEMVGKIDVLKGYKLQADVDEFYINRVKEGQKGVAEINGVQYGLVLHKVIPEIVSGQFQVELVFEGKSAPDLKRGLTVQAKITLSGNKRGLLLPQGQFFQSTGGSWVFVVENGRARKRQVRLGRKNYIYFEVVEGLRKDERVIISSYDRFSKYDAIDMNGEKKTSYDKN